MVMLSVESALNRLPDVFVNVSLVLWLTDALRLTLPSWDVNRTKLANLAAHFFKIIGLPP